MGDPRVLVLILTFDDYQDTLECLECIRELPTHLFDVIVCDNGSRDEVATRLATAIETHHPYVRLIRTPVNLGFAGGNAFALQTVSGDVYSHILLLNNDTVTTPDDLQLLVGMARERGSGIAGPTITYYDRRDVIWQGGGYLISWLGQLWVPDKNRRLPTTRPSAIPVDYVSGCAMLIDADLIRTQGFLDTSYFYSVEDLDYCTAARRNHWSVEYFTAPVVAHKVSKTSGGWQSSFSATHAVFGKGRFIRKHIYGWRRVTSVLYQVTIIIPVRWWRARDIELRALRRLYGAFLKGLGEKL